MKKYTLGQIALWVFFSILIISILPGCAGKKRVEKETFFEKWKDKAEKSRGYSPGPTSSVADTMDKDTTDTKEMDVPLQDTRVTGEDEAVTVQEIAPELEKPLPKDKIAMKMHDVELSVLLRALAKAANQNIMINDKVKGRASINLTAVPWDQVFLGILKTNGLTYTWEGDIIRIVSLADINHEMELMAASQKKEKQEREHALKMNSLQSRAQMVEPLQTWIYHVKYADTETLRKNLDEFFRTGWVGTDITIGPEDQGKVESKLRGAILVDPHTNSLVIQAIKSDIERLKETVMQLDRPTPQVLIEAQIVETNWDTARELGVQWGGLYKHTTGDGVNHYITPGANSAGVTGNSLDAGIDPITGNVVNFPAAVSAGGSGLMLGYVAEKVGKTLISAQLSALQNEGKLNILSSPSITTLDNQEATIESGKEVPYQTVENDNVKIEYKKVVLELVVTPYVIDGKTLKLEIRTKKDELDISSVQGNPIVITKKAKTTVVLFDGQTTVIGGLSKEKSDHNEQGVPGFKDIPLLGWFFKNTSKKNEMEELLIFITPHILKEQIAGETEKAAPANIMIPQDISPQPEEAPQ